MLITVTNVSNHYSQDTGLIAVGCRMGNGKGPSNLPRLICHRESYASSVKREDTFINVRVKTHTTAKRQPKSYVTSEDMF